MMSAIFALIVALLLWMFLGLMVNQMNNWVLEDIKHQNLRIMLRTLGFILWPLSLVLWAAFIVGVFVYMLIESIFKTLIK